MIYLLHIYIYIGLHTDRVKRYGTITGIVETIRYFIGTAIGILNYAKYTLSVVPDIKLKHICCLSCILITSCEK